MAELRFGILPVQGPITQNFGDMFSGYAHRGTDFGVPVGTSVLAPAEGISVPFTNDGSFGNGVCLQHPGTPWYSLYAHLSSVYAWVGKTVQQGDILGYSGNTGMSTGPHLHWQVCYSSMFPISISQSADPMSFYHPEDDMALSPQERIEFDQMKRVLCEWGMPGRLPMLDGMNIDIYQSILNQNTALEQLKTVLRQQGIQGIPY